MASGDVKMAVLGNIHMYIRVIEVSDFKSDFKFLLLSSLPCIVARSSKGPLPSGSVILFSHFPLFRKQRLRELLAFFPASTCAAILQALRRGAAEDEASWIHTSIRFVIVNCQQILIWNMEQLNFQ